MPIAFESITPSAGDATDRFTVRRGAGPLDHTMELLSPASVKVLLAIVAADIGDLAEAVDDRVANLLVAGAGVTLTYDDVANTLTIAASGGGGGTDLGYTAATRLLTSSTGADVTLPLVSSADAGLAPASGGGTTNFLRADGTWAAPGGGGATNLSYDAPSREVRSDTGTDAVLTLVDNTNPGLALAPEVGPDRFFAFTDLVNTTTSELFAVSTAGTSASVTIVAPQDGGHGWAQLNLGTTTTGRAGIGTVTFNLRFGLGAAGFKARYRATNLSDATNTYTKRVGFVDSLAAESTDGAFFRYTHSVNGGRWQAVTRSNNVETAVDTGVTVAANTTYKFEVDVNAAGNEAVFKIDGTTVATITTNIPTGSGRETGYGSFALRSAGTSAFSPGALDYLWVEQRFTGR